MRYLVPVILFAVAAYVWHYNDSHTDSWLLVPFLDRIPSLANNPDGQAEWSWRIIAGIGVIAFLTTVIQDVRNRQRSRTKSDS
jgi:hypothetical protein